MKLVQARRKMMVECRSCSNEKAKCDYCGKVELSRNMFQDVYSEEEKRINENTVFVGKVVKNVCSQCVHDQNRYKKFLEPVEEQPVQAVEEEKVERGKRNRKNS